MPAWWKDQASDGWRMSYSGDDARTAEETADKLRREGKQTKVVRKMVHSFAGKPYMEYVTLWKD